jgi:hypothetical protein
MHRLTVVGLYRRLSFSSLYAVWGVHPDWVELRATRVRQERLV